MKRFLYAAAISVFTAFTLSAFEQPYFNGYTGFLTGIQNEEDSDKFDPYFSGETFFAGQIDFGGQLFLRGEFYVKADNIFDYNVLNESESDPNAYFRIEELSATYKMNSMHASHYFSIYRGNFEPIGSDLFLQRQFGIEPIRSSFTDSYHGLAGAVFYPLYAFGIGYVFHPEADLAFGANLYKNKAAEESEGADDVLNFDLRFAGLLGSAVFDSSVGIALPSNDTDENEDALIVIKDIQFHGGMNFLVGNRNTTSLLVKFGVNRFLLKKDSGDSDALNIEDVYAFIEARALGEYISIDTSGFLFPEASAEDMIFLRHVIKRYPGTENIFGMNLNIYSERLYLGSTHFTLGNHTTLAVSRVDPDGDDDTEISLTISPYAGIEILGGTLNASASINTIDLFKNPEKCYSLTLGFKTNF